MLLNTMQLCENVFQKWNADGFA